MRLDIPDLFGQPFVFVVVLEVRRSSFGHRAVAARSPDYSCMGEILSVEIRLKQNRWLCREGSLRSAAMRSIRGSSMLFVGLWGVFRLRDPGHRTQWESGLLR